MPAESGFVVKSVREGVSEAFCVAVTLCTLLLGVLNLMT